MISHSPAFAADWARLEAFLNERLTGDDPFLRELSLYAFRLGGKRLRPALVILTGRLWCKSLDERLLHFAAAVELIHTATLIHDDIIDGASVRRHLATMNSRWDAATGVLAGDLLLSEAMRLVTSHNDIAAYRMLAESLHVTCRGELRQRGTSGNIDLTRDTYFSIIGEKTAALMASCCQLGSHLAGASEQIASLLYDFGFKLGLAFQIADDVLDISGNESQTGKTLGTDLSQRKMTLPLLIYLARDSKNLSRVRSALTSATMTQDEAAMIANAVCESGATTEALDEAKSFARNAATLLDDERLATANPDAIEALRTLTDFVVRRTT
ncbi:MAG: polyprenyl synthetase family protein [Thermoguttaceae bacterium]